MYDEAVRCDLLELQDTQQDQNATGLLAAYRQGGWRGYWAARAEEMRGKNSEPLLSPGRRDRRAARRAPPRGHYGAAARC